MDPHIQDFNNYVIKKDTNKTAKKPIINRPASVLKTKIDENGEEVVKLKTVSSEMANFIIKARMEKKLKQDELAKQVNLDVNIIKTIEKGGCPYKADQINKISKVLGNIPRK
jgi:ribosome-binding protein aMBF1 (putative translation factor)